MLLVKPLGTELLLTVETARSRLATLEGAAQVETPKGEVVVRAGFEVEVARGKDLALARPLASKLPAWLPASARPKRVPAVEVLRTFSFDDALEGFRRGRLAKGGARSSAGALEGVPAEASYAVFVEWEDLRGIATIDPSLWLEATVRVDKRTTVALQLWDVDRKENLAKKTTVEANRWTTVAFPLREFGDAAGRPLARPLGAGDRATCFSVFAGESGEKVTLLVDDVRFWRER